MRSSDSALLCAFTLAVSCSKQLYTNALLLSKARGAYLPHLTCLMLR